jgi:anthranilate synthase component 2
MKSIAIIDNYDSFTYNLDHLVKELGAQTTVLRNDRFRIGDLEPYEGILLSPGPGIPSEAGLMPEVIRAYAGRKPILGICLGEQAIGEAFGGRLVNLDDVFHGVQTPCRILKDDYIFEGLPEEIQVGRYHSWVVDAASLPECLEILADSREGQVMALRHRSLDLRGIQFHPESVLTPEGRRIISNWLKHK